EERLAAEATAKEDAKLAAAVEAEKVRKVEEAKLAAEQARKAAVEVARKQAQADAQMFMDIKKHIVVQKGDDAEAALSATEKLNAIAEKRGENNIEEVLILGLGHRNPDIQKLAAETLGRRAIDTEETVNALKALRDDEGADGVACRAAHEALAKIEKANQESAEAKIAEAKRKEEERLAAKAKAKEDARSAAEEKARLAAEEKARAREEKAERKRIDKLAARIGMEKGLPRDDVMQYYNNEFIPSAQAVGLDPEKATFKQVGKAEREKLVEAEEARLAEAKHLKAEEDAKLAVEAEARRKTAEEARKAEEEAKLAAEAKGKEEVKLAEARRRFEEARKAEEAKRKQLAATQEAREKEEKAERKRIDKLARRMDKKKGLPVEEVEKFYRGEFIARAQSMNLDPEKVTIGQLKRAERKYQRELAKQREEEKVAVSPEDKEPPVVLLQVDDFMAQLGDEDAKVRKEAADKLGNIGADAKDAISALNELLKDKDDSVRQAAEKAILNIDPTAKVTTEDVTAPTIKLTKESSIEELIEALKDTDKKTRYLAVSLLGEKGSDAKPAVRALTRALRDNEEDVRAASAYALGLIGADAKSAARALRKRLGDKRESVTMRKTAATALGQIGSGTIFTVRALRKAVEDENAEIRTAAIWSLSGIGRGVKSSVSVISGRLTDANAEVREAAAHALGNIGPAAAGAVDALKEALNNDKAQKVREAAVYALGKIGPTKEKKADVKEAEPIELTEFTGVDKLIEALGHSNPEVRKTAEALLVKVSFVTDTALLPALEKLAQDENGYVATVAKAYIAKIKEASEPVSAKKTVNDFIAELRNPGVASKVREDAAWSLGRMGKAAGPAVRALEERLKDYNEDVRVAAAWALAEIGQDAAVVGEALLDALKDENIYVRDNARRAIDNIGASEDPEVLKRLEEAEEVKVLIGGLVGKDARRSIEAADQLGELGKDARPAVKYLADVLKDGKNTQARIRAAYAIGMIGSYSDSTVLALEAATGARNAAVRTAAVSVLNTMDIDVLHKIPILVKALADRVEHVREYAVGGLSKIGHKAVPAITNALNPKNPETMRIAAARVLSKIGPDAKKSVPALINIAQDKDEDIRAASIDALGKIGAEREAITPLIREALKDKSAKVRRYAIVAIVRLNQAEAIPDVLPLLHDKDVDVRITAIKVLGNLNADGQGAILDLIILLGDKNEKIVQAANNALINIGPIKGIELLLKLRALKAHANTKISAKAHLYIEQIMRDRENSFDSFQGPEYRELKKLIKRAAMQEALQQVLIKQREELDSGEREIETEETKRIKELDKALEPVKDKKKQIRDLNKQKQELINDKREIEKAEEEIRTEEAALPAVAERSDTAKLLNFLRTNTKTIGENTLPLSFFIRPGDAAAVDSKLSDIYEKRMVNRMANFYDASCSQVLNVYQAGPEWFDERGDDLANILDGGYWGEMKLWSDEVANFPDGAEIQLVFRSTDGQGEWLWEGLEWPEWRPVAGENAWTALGLLHTHFKKHGAKPEDSTELKVAQKIGNSLIKMQAENGGIRYAPRCKENGKVNEAHWHNISTENNLSAYALFRALYEITGNERYLEAMKGIEGYLKTVAVYDAGAGHCYFYQGANFKGDRWIPSRGNFATDCQTWAISVLGPKKVDEIFGQEGAAFMMWQATRDKAGQQVSDGRLLGLAYTERQNNISIEWTAGGIQAVLELAFNPEYEDVRNNSPLKVQGVINDARSMRASLSGFKVELADNMDAYPYAKEAGPTGHGWKAPPREVSSTASTSWIGFIDNRINPFVLGGKISGADKLFEDTGEKESAAADEKARQRQRKRLQERKEKIEQEIEALESQVEVVKKQALADIEPSRDAIEGILGKAIDLEKPDALEALTEDVKDYKSKTTQAMKAKLDQRIKALGNKIENSRTKRDGINDLVGKLGIKEIELTFIRGEADSAAKDWQAATEAYAMRRQDELARRKKAEAAYARKLAAKAQKILKKQQRADKAAAKRKEASKDKDAKLELSVSESIGVLRRQSEHEDYVARGDHSGQDVDVELRREAAKTLGENAPDSAKAAELLVQRLSDTDAVVRSFAAWALGRIKYGSENEAPALTARLIDTDANVRASAAFALGEIGYRSARYELIDLLRDPDEDVRKSAKDALSKFDTLSIPYLEELKKDDDEHVAEFARERLALAREEVENARAEHEKSLTPEQIRRDNLSLALHHAKRAHESLDSELVGHWQREGWRGPHEGPGAAAFDELIHARYELRANQQRLSELWEVEKNKRYIANEFEGEKDKRLGGYVSPNWLIRSDSEDGTRLSEEDTFSAEIARLQKKITRFSRTFAVSEDEDIPVLIRMHYERMLRRVSLRPLYLQAQIQGLKERIVALEKELDSTREGISPEAAEVSRIREEIEETKDAFRRFQEEVRRGDRYPAGAGSAAASLEVIIKAKQKLEEKVPELEKAKRKEAAKEREAERQLRDNWLTRWKTRWRPHRFNMSRDYHSGDYRYEGGGFGAYEDLDDDVRTALSTIEDESEALGISKHEDIDVLKLRLGIARAVAKAVKAHSDKKPKENLESEASKGPEAKLYEKVASAKARIQQVREDFISFRKEIIDYKTPKYASLLEYRKALDEKKAELAELRKQGEDAAYLEKITAERKPHKAVMTDSSTDPTKEILGRVDELSNDINSLEATVKRLSGGLSVSTTVGIDVLQKRAADEAEQAFMKMQDLEIAMTLAAEELNSLLEQVNALSEKGTGSGGGQQEDTEEARLLVMIADTRKKLRQARAKFEYRQNAFKGLSTFAQLIRAREALEKQDAERAEAVRKEEEYQKLHGESSGTKLDFDKEDKETKAQKENIRQLSIKADVPVDEDIEVLKHRVEARIKNVGSELKELGAEIEQLSKKLEGLAGRAEALEKKEGEESEAAEAAPETEEAEAKTAPAVTKKSLEGPKNIPDLYKEDTDALIRRTRRLGEERIISEDEKAAFIGTEKEEEKPFGLLHITPKNKLLTPATQSYVKEKLDIREDQLKAEAVERDSKRDLLKAYSDEAAPSYLKHKSAEAQADGATWDAKHLAMLANNQQLAGEIQRTQGIKGARIGDIPVRFTLGFNMQHLSGALHQVDISSDVLGGVVIGGPAYYFTEATKLLNAWSKDGKLNAGGYAALAVSILQIAESGFELKIKKDGGLYLNPNPLYGKFHLNPHVLPDGTIETRSRGLNTKPITDLIGTVAPDIYRLLTRKWEKGIVVYGPSQEEILKEGYFTDAHQTKTRIMVQRGQVEWVDVTNDFADAGTKYLEAGVLRSIKSEKQTRFKRVKRLAKKAVEVFVKEEEVKRLETGGAVYLSDPSQKGNPFAYYIEDNRVYKRKTGVADSNRLFTWRVSLAGQVVNGDKQLDITIDLTKKNIKEQIKDKLFKGRRKDKKVGLDFKVKEGDSKKIFVSDPTLPGEPFRYYIERYIDEEDNEKGRVFEREVGPMGQDEFWQKHASGELKGAIYKERPTKPKRHGYWVDEKNNQVIEYGRKELLFAADMFFKQSEKHLRKHGLYVEPGQAVVHSSIYDLANSEALRQNLFKHTCIISADEEDNGRLLQVFPSGHMPRPVWSDQLAENVDNRYSFDEDGNVKLSPGAPVYAYAKDPITGERKLGIVVYGYEDIVNGIQDFEGRHVLASVNNGTEAKVLFDELDVPAKDGKTTWLAKKGKELVFINKEGRKQTITLTEDTWLTTDPKLAGSKPKRSEAIASRLFLKRKVTGWRGRPVAIVRYRDEQQRGQQLPYMRVQGANRTTRIVDEEEYLNVRRNSKVVPEGGFENMDYGQGLHDYMAPGTLITYLPAYATTVKYKDADGNEAEVVVPAIVEICARGKELEEKNKGREATVISKGQTKLEDGRVNDVKAIEFGVETATSFETKIERPAFNVSMLKGENLEHLVYIDDLINIVSLYNKGKEQTPHLDNMLTQLRRTKAVGRTTGRDFISQEADAIKAEFASYMSDVINYRRMALDYEQMSAEKAEAFYNSMAISTETINRDLGMKYYLAWFMEGYKIWYSESRTQLEDHILLVDGFIAEKNRQIGNAQLAGRQDLEDEFTQQRDGLIQERDAVSQKLARLTENPSLANISWHDDEDMDIEEKREAAKSWIRAMATERILQADEALSDIERNLSNARAGKAARDADLVYLDGEIRLVQGQLNDPALNLTPAARASLEAYLGDLQTAKQGLQQHIEELQGGLDILTRQENLAADRKAGAEEYYYGSVIPTIDEVLSNIEQYIDAKKNAADALSEAMKGQEALERLNKAVSKYKKYLVKQGEHLIGRQEDGILSKAWDMRDKLHEVVSKSSTLTEEEKEREHARIDEFSSRLAALRPGVSQFVFTKKQLGNILNSATEPDSGTYILSLFDMTRNDTMGGIVTLSNALTAFGQKLDLVAGTIKLDENARTTWVRGGGMRSRLGKRGTNNFLFLHVDSTHYAEGVSKEDWKEEKEVEYLMADTFTYDIAGNLHISGAGFLVIPKDSRGRAKGGSAKLTYDIDNNKRWHVVIDAAHIKSTRSGAEGVLSHNAAGEEVWQPIYMHMSEKFITESIGIEFTAKDGNREKGYVTVSLANEEETGKWARHEDVFARIAASKTFKSRYTLGGSADLNSELMRFSAGASAKLPFHSEVYAGYSMDERYSKDKLQVGVNAPLWKTGFMGDAKYILDKDRGGFTFGIGKSLFGQKRENFVARRADDKVRERTTAAQMNARRYEWRRANKLDTPGTVELLTSTSKEAIKAIDADKNIPQETRYILSPEGQAPNGLIKSYPGDSVKGMLSFTEHNGVHGISIIYAIKKVNELGDKEAASRLDDRLRKLLGYYYNTAYKGWKIYNPNKPFPGFKEAYHIQGKGHAFGSVDNSANIQFAIFLDEYMDYADVRDKDKAEDKKEDLKPYKVMLADILGSFEGDKAVAGVLAFADNSGHVASGQEGLEQFVYPAEDALMLYALMQRTRVKKLLKDHPGMNQRPFRILTRLKESFTPEDAALAKSRDRFIAFTIGPNNPTQAQYIRKYIDDDTLRVMLGDDNHKALQEYAGSDKMSPLRLDVIFTVIDEEEEKLSEGIAERIRGRNIQKNEDLQKLIAIFTNPNDEQKAGFDYMFGKGSEQVIRILSVKLSELNEKGYARDREFATEVSSSFISAVGPEYINRSSEFRASKDVMNDVGKFIVRFYEGYTYSLSNVELIFFRAIQKAGVFTAKLDEEGKVVVEDGKTVLDVTGVGFRNYAGTDRTPVVSVELTAQLLIEDAKILSAYFREQGQNDKADFYNRIALKAQAYLDNLADYLPTGKNLPYAVDMDEGTAAGEDTGDGLKTPYSYGPTLPSSQLYLASSGASVLGKDSGIDNIDKDRVEREYNVVRASVSPVGLKAMGLAARDRARLYYFGRDGPVYVNRQGFSLHDQKEFEGRIIKLPKVIKSKDLEQLNKDYETYKIRFIEHKGEIGIVGERDTAGKDFLAINPNNALFLSKDRDIVIGMIHAPTKIIHFSLKQMDKEHQMRTAADSYGIVRFTFEEDQGQKAPRKFTKELRLKALKIDDEKCKNAGVRTEEFEGKPGLYLKREKSYEPLDPNMLVLLYVIDDAGNKVFLDESNQTKYADKKMRLAVVEPNLRSAKEHEELINSLGEFIPIRNKVHYEEVVKGLSEEEREEKTIVIHDAKDKIVAVYIGYAGLVWRWGKEPVKLTKQDLLDMKREENGSLGSIEIPGRYDYTGNKVCKLRAVDFIKGKKNITGDIQLTPLGAQVLYKQDFDNSKYPGAETFYETMEFEMPPEAKRPEDEKKEEAPAPKTEQPEGEETPAPAEEKPEAKARPIQTIIRPFSQEVGTAEKETVKKLIEALKDKNDDVRRSAAEALGEIGSDAKSAISALTEALKDENGDVRVYAAEALGEIGPAAKSAIPALTEALKDEGMYVRFSAAEALSKIKSTISPLIEALKDKDWIVRVLVAQTLGEMGPEAKDAIPALTEVLKTEALKDEDWPVRYRAACALGEIGPAAKSAIPALTEALQEALKDKDWLLCNSAARALGNIGAASKEAAPVLRRLAEQGAPKYVRTTAAEALKKITSEKPQTIIKPFKEEVGPPAEGSPEAKARPIKTIIRPFSQEVKGVPARRLVKIQLPKFIRNAKGQIVFERTKIRPLNSKWEYGYTWVNQLNGKEVEFIFTTAKKEKGKNREVAKIDENGYNLRAYNDDGSFDDYSRGRKFKRGERVGTYLYGSESEMKKGLADARKKLEEKFGKGSPKITRKALLEASKYKAKYEKTRKYSYFDGVDGTLLSLQFKEKEGADGKVVKDEEGNPIMVADGYKRCPGEERAPDAKKEVVKSRVIKREIVEEFIPGQDKSKRRSLASDRLDFEKIRYQYSIANVIVERNSRGEETKAIGYAYVPETMQPNFDRVLSETKDDDRALVVDKIDTNGRRIIKDGKVEEGEACKVKEHKEYRYIKDKRILRHTRYFSCNDKGVVVARLGYGRNKDNKDVPVNIQFVRYKKTLEIGAFVYDIKKNPDGSIPKKIETEGEWFERADAMSEVLDQPDSPIFKAVFGDIKPEDVKCRATFPQEDRMVKTFSLKGPDDKLVKRSFEIPAGDYALLCVFDETFKLKRVFAMRMGERYEGIRYYKEDKMAAFVERDELDYETGAIFFGYDDETYVPSMGKDAKILASSKKVSELNKDKPNITGEKIIISNKEHDTFAYEEYDQHDANGMPANVKDESQREFAADKYGTEQARFVEASKGANGIFTKAHILSYDTMPLNIYNKNIGKAETGKATIEVKAKTHTINYASTTRTYTFDAEEEVKEVVEYTGKSFVYNKQTYLILVHRREGKKDRYFASILEKRGEKAKITLVNDGDLTKCNISIKVPGTEYGTENFLGVDLTQAEPLKGKKSYSTTDQLKVGDNLVTIGGQPVLIERKTLDNSIVSIFAIDTETGDTTATFLWNTAGEIVSVVIPTGKRGKDVIVANKYEAKVLPNGTVETGAYKGKSADTGFTTDIKGKTNIPILEHYDKNDNLIETSAATVVDGLKQEAKFVKEDEAGPITHAIVSTGDKGAGKTVSTKHAVKVDGKKITPDLAKPREGRSADTGFTTDIKGKTNIPILEHYDKNDNLIETSAATVVDGLKQEAKFVKED
ncbi:MAG: HEAT repeat domain-containing protein, partial [Candidatus Omnitrophica bacterium]|nr:HEAT repeat domain-containing protein [Candidatus Omnitrophota bacterium]